MNLRKITLAATVAIGAVVAASGAQAANVAVIAGGWYTSDLANQLVAHGNTVSEISFYDAGTLAGYDAVVQYGNDYVDQDALISFVSGGGTLVLTPWAGSNFDVVTQLRVFQNGGSDAYNDSSPGMTVLDAGSSLLNGVSFPGAGETNIGRIGEIGFADGASAVANWADGAALLGYRNFGGGAIVGVNLQVITSDTAYGVINEGWASQLLDNAVNFEGASSPAPEPASWAMMLGGFGMIGGALRSRRKASVSFA